MYRESFPCPTSAVRLAVSSQKVDGAHEKYLARLVTGTPVFHTPTHSQYPLTSKHSQSWATYYVISMAKVKSHIFMASIAKVELHIM